jgi:hypothetical protein
MSRTLLLAGTWLYEQCVTFVIHLADLLDVTYRDSNSLIFFLIWPGITLALLGWVVWNAVALRIERRRAGGTATPGSRRRPRSHPAAR